MDNNFPVEAEEEIGLLREVGRGDRASFEQIYDRFSRPLFSIAYRVLNNREAAEDVLQDVFVQIWNKAALYDPARGRPLTWAITITRNKAVDRLRSLQRRGRLHEEVERETTVQEQTASHATSADEADTTSRAAVIRAAVMTLSPEQRRAIELAFFGGLTQVQIAQHLHEPLGTVKARIRRGMMKLKESVTPFL